MEMLWDYLGLLYDVGLNGFRDVTPKTENKINKKLKNKTALR